MNSSFRDYAFDTWVDMMMTPYVVMLLGRFRKRQDSRLLWRFPFCSCYYPNVGLTSAINTFLVKMSLSRALIPTKDFYFSEILNLPFGVLSINPVFKEKVITLWIDENENTSRKPGHYQVTMPDEQVLSNWWRDG